MRSAAFLVLLSLSWIAPAVAQSNQPPAGNPLVTGTKAWFGIVKGYITKAADQVPEDLYAFKATPEVRSFAQLFGHIADSNYQICGAAAGEKPPVEGIEKSKSAKSDLAKALADSFAYCDKVFAGMSDTDAATMVNFFGNQQPKLVIMAFNNSHDFEHYGNIVTYMRLNKMVPPSSQKMK